MAPLFAITGIEFALPDGADYEALLKEIDAKEEAAARKWCADSKLDYVSRRQGLRQGIAEGKLPPARIGLDPRDLGLERIARKGLERLRWELEPCEPVALSVYSGRTPEVKNVSAPTRMPADRMTAGELEATCILAGGDPFSPKEPVTPGVLSVSLVRGERLAAASLPTDIAGRRLALAEWIASRDNPLTARVIVNRIWQGHFGRGIAGIRALFEIDEARRRTGVALLIFMIAYNAVAVGLAVAGWMNPLFAAVLMPLSSLATLVIVGMGMRGIWRSRDRTGRPGDVRPQTVAVTPAPWESRR